MCGEKNHEESLRAFRCHPWLHGPSCLIVPHCPGDGTHTPAALGAMWLLYDGVSAPHEQSPLCSCLTAGRGEGGLGAAPPERAGGWSWHKSSAQAGLGGAHLPRLPHLPHLPRGEPLPLTAQRRHSVCSLLRGSFLGKTLGAKKGLRSALEDAFWVASRNLR